MEILNLDAKIKVAEALVKSEIEGTLENDYSLKDLDGSYLRITKEIEDQFKNEISELSTLYYEKGVDEITYTNEYVNSIFCNKFHQLECGV